MKTEQDKKKERKKENKKEQQRTLNQKNDRST
jgi:hypothetical protein